MSETNGLIVELMQALHREGVAMADIGLVEARIVTLVEKARRINRAASMLPLIGPDATAERLGCCRQTVYNLAARARKKSKNNRDSLTAA